MQKIAVLGLGRFGMRLACELAASGVEVIAADRNGRLVDDAKDYVTLAVQMDFTDEDALQSQNIGKVDVCIVAIGEGFEATLLTTLNVKKLGVPRVIARAQTVVQAEILSRIGADEIVQPENAAARELARRLSHPRLLDFVQLDASHSIFQLHAPRRFVGKTLEELRLRTAYRVNLIAIKRRESVADGTTREQIISVPDKDDTIQEGDTLVLVGNDEAIASLPRD
ncbi:MAG: TrkA family potassium uptake protein [Pirellulaceae bacterium]